VHSRSTPYAFTRRPSNTLILGLDQVRESLKDGSALQVVNQVVGAASEATNDPQHLAKSHVRSLEKDLEPTARAERYANLTWRLISDVQSRCPLILGDLGPLAKYSASDTSLVSPVTENSQPLLLCLPVSPTLLLLGSEPGAPIPSPDEVNLASAELSCEYIIGSQRTPDESHLQNRIGERAELMSPEEISRSVSSAFGDLMKDPSL
jgi:hypothetical protein